MGPEVRIEACGWHRESTPDGGDLWRTGCDNLQEFMDGDWRQNSYRFCPYCGGEICEIPSPV